MAAFSPLFREVGSKGDSQSTAQVPGSSEGRDTGTFCVARVGGIKGSRGPRGPHPLLCIWERNQAAPELPEAPLGWSQCCEQPGMGDSWSVPKGRREISPAHVTWSIWMAL